MRNIWCSQYNDCLTRAAIEDSAGFDCSGCPQMEDNSGQVKDPAVIREEALKCTRLLLKVFPRLERRFGVNE